MSYHIFNATSGDHYKTTETELGIKKAGRDLFGCELDEVVLAEADGDPTTLLVYIVRHGGLVPRRDQYKLVAQMDGHPDIITITATNYVREGK